MPIRWYGPANPEEPTYRHFERIVNLTLHAALFSALNSGLWVVQELRHPWAHLNWLTLGVLAYPAMYGVGWLFIRLAEQSERDFIGVVDAGDES